MELIFCSVFNPKVKDGLVSKVLWAFSVSYVPGAGEMELIFCSVFNPKV